MSSQIDLFTIYMVLMPLAVAALGLSVFWFTGWLDRREERRRHAAE
jgi:hypothetical protein